MIIMNDEITKEPYDDKCTKKLQKTPKIIYEREKL